MRVGDVPELFAALPIQTPDEAVAPPRDQRKIVEGDATTCACQVFSARLACEDGFVGSEVPKFDDSLVVDA